MLSTRRILPLPPKSSVCIGAFDGMHLGHQALLHHARTLAQPAAVLTFDPHPAAVLNPQRAPPLLQSHQQFHRVCQALGVDSLCVVPFTRELAATSAEAFVDHLLVRGLAPAFVVVGADFRFGAGRSGGTTELQSFLHRAGIELAVVAPVPMPTLDDPASPAELPTTGKLSSSAIRLAVRAGAVSAATQMLGRWYTVTGSVVRGAGRGAGLGYPTANIQTTGLLPAEGVYAGALGIVGDASAAWPAAINLGRNPTFVDNPNAPPVLEVHVVGRDLGDTLLQPNVEVEVAFACRLRPEQRFASIASLTDQLARDIAAVPAAISQNHLHTFATILQPPP